MDSNDKESAVTDLAPMPDGIQDIPWSPSPLFLAESCHVAWAIATILASLHHGITIEIAVPLFLVFALFKEFVVDVSLLAPVALWLRSHNHPILATMVNWFNLEKDTWEGSTMDFLFYFIGAVTGVIGYYYFWPGLLMGIGILLILMFLDREELL